MLMSVSSHMIPGKGPLQGIISDRVRASVGCYHLHQVDSQICTAVMLPHKAQPSLISRASPGIPTAELAQFSAPHLVPGRRCTLLLRGSTPAGRLAASVTRKCRPSLRHCTCSLLQFYHVMRLLHFLTPYFPSAFASLLLRLRS